MQNEPSPILPPLFPVRGDTKYCHLLDLILQLLLLASPFMSVTLLVIALRILCVVLNNPLPGDGRWCTVPAALCSDWQNTYGSQSTRGLDNFAINQTVIVLNYMVLYPSRLRALCKPSSPSTLPLQTITNLFLNIWRSCSRTLKQSSIDGFFSLFITKLNCFKCICP